MQRIDADLALAEQLVQHAVVVIVDRQGFEGAADGQVFHAVGRGEQRFGHAAADEQIAPLRGGGGGGGASQLYREVHRDEGGGHQLLRAAKVAAHQVAVDVVGR